jgi:hypothetical protein
MGSLAQARQEGNPMKKCVPILLAILPALISMVTNQPARADSATWNLDPVNGDWNTAANSTPNTVPNSPDDVAAKNNL